MSLPIARSWQHTESTHRQYDLRQRAIALGWPEERIEVIDCDQAHSGQSAGERDGFQYLVSQVGLDRAGLVMGLEVSHLARNCADWHFLPFGICLVVARLFYQTQPLLAFAVLLAGATSIVFLCWRFVLPARITGWVRTFLGKAFCSLPEPTHVG